MCRGNAEVGEVEGSSARARFTYGISPAPPRHCGPIMLAVAALLSLSVYWLGPTLVIALSAITVGLASPKGWARPTAISLGAAAAIAFVVVTLLQIG